MRKSNDKLLLVAVDIRSTYNIGSILRTCDGFGAEAFFVGICPLPAHEGDTRLPHIVKRAQKAIEKTALGAEQTVSWRYAENLESCLTTLRVEGYQIIAIEQDSQSKNINEVHLDGPKALIVGREVEGLTSIELQACDLICEIPMKGKKESFNVSVAAAIALYHFSK